MPKASNAQIAYIRRTAGVEYDTSAKWTARTAISCKANGWIEQDGDSRYNHKVTAEGMRVAGINPAAVPAA